jgi:DNA-binding transcriptional LysR family regulator
MLDVKRMRVLREVAKQGSFSAAADALSYTQSAVSQQIAALEREAGTTLVERSARGIRLTDAGEALVRHAEKVMASLAEAEAELDAIAGLRSGRVRLASFPTAGSALVPLAIANFRQRHPAVELNLSEMEPDESIPQLRAGELDIALIFEPNDANDAEALDRTELLDDPFFLVTAEDHPMAKKPKLSLKDFASEPWINTTGTCACGQIMRGACVAAGFEPHTAFESDDYLLVQGLVAAGVGVALLPDLALTTVRDDVVIRELPKPPVRHVVALTLPGAYRSPATTAMLEILQEAATTYRKKRFRLAAAS